MTFTDLLEAIAASNLNEAQKRAARRYAFSTKRNVTSTLEGDEPEYEISADACGAFASLSIFADGRLYSTMLTTVLGPRGGRSHMNARKYFQHGGEARFYI